MIQQFIEVLSVNVKLFAIKDSSSWPTWVETWKFIKHICEFCTKWEPNLMAVLSNTAVKIHFINKFQFGFQKFKPNRPFGYRRPLLMMFI